MGRPAQTLTVLGVAALLTLIAGCGSSREQAGGSDTQTERTVSWRDHEADFVPSNHEPRGESAPDGRTFSGQNDVLDDAGTRGQQGTEELVQGFRVQLYTSTRIDDARHRKLDLESQFPDEWFYLEFDPPSYKIRAGNFLNRFEADRFARVLAERGYVGAWAVPARIFQHPGKRPLPQTDQPDAQPR